MFATLSTNGSFDLVQTLDSGQVFHWEAAALEGRDGFAGCIGDKAVWVGPAKSDSVVTRTEDAEIVASYFRFDEAIAEIQREFPAGDRVLAEAIAYCPGLRILRQPVWECLATFITSSLKQVAHIRQISLKLRRRFGRRRRIAGKTVYSYPTPEAIARAGEKALRECALGYRARGLCLTAERIASGDADLSELDSLDDSEAREFLMRFHGVGEKIANCVLLFGCGRFGAFPIDVWIDRILREHYFGPRKRKTLKAPDLQRWAHRHFGPNGGFAQQYLFHFARKTFK